MPPTPFTVSLAVAVVVELAVVRACRPGAEVRDIAASLAMFLVTSHSRIVEPVLVVITAVIRLTEELPERWADFVRAATTSVVLDHQSALAIHHRHIELRRSAIELDVSLCYGCRDTVAVVNLTTGKIEFYFCFFIVVVTIRSQCGAGQVLT